MNRNNFSHLMISIFRKMVLVLSGLILSLALLEVGLRLGGFILSSLQEYENLQSIKQKGAYRILCLGESTTQGQYPKPLEQILNQHNIGLHFSVIDRGRVAKMTNTLLEEIEPNLAKYHPNMVVAMMGNNDSGVKYYQDIPEADTWLFKHCQVYRFGRILCMHLVNMLRKRDIHSFDRTDLGRNDTLEDAKTASKKSNLSDERSAEKVARLDFQGAEETYGPSSSYLIDGRIPKAEESLKEAIKMNPHDDKAYVGLGAFYMRQSKYLLAADSFKKAIAVNPKNANAYVGLGYFYKEREVFSQAENSFKKAIEMDPENEKAYAGLGKLYESQGKLSQAEDSFKKAIEMNPGNSKVYAGLGEVYENQGRLSQAEGSYRKAVEINPKSDRVYVALGEVYLFQGEFSQAMASFKKAIEINPGNDRARDGLKWLHQDQGKFSQAEEFYRKAIEINPENDNAYVDLGQLYRDQGNLPRAEDSFRRAIEINPKNHRAYVSLGKIYLFQEKSSQAIASFEKVIELNIRDVFVFFSLGRLYRNQDDLSRAEDSFRSAIEIDPQNELVLGAMASLYEEMGKPELAKVYAEKANRLRSEHYPAITVTNYRKLKEILDRKGIKLVCVQYPLRNVEPLKRIFEKDSDVIFVDNEHAFKEAVKRSGYKEYFKDMFAGDFGHCTQKGNELLAQNIAHVILKEVFNKQ